ncbi:hypothetical protein MHO82_00515 [Vibrio sp. Of7-15]|uniref:hypothetical protein n=1 Tax=Vibrio sp. Of7-15 TaxID=2724879 RepID=UPI001EF3691B|nr:hypothetical protein [Vibrio sp. Of7-15]MCG7495340.1 hypothetical protein [Vibrio sp. Of7-15]
MNYYKTQIFIFSCTSISIMLIVFVVNLLVDPLWYFNGNKVTDRNFAFNERVSKVNQFHNKKDNIDCLIFGSSRTTLIHESKFQDNTCFNMSFSAGRIDEFIQYSDYLLSYSNNKIDKVIISIEPQNYFSTIPVSVPDFIHTMEKPDSFLSAYFSMDSFIYSLRTLVGLSPLEREYNKNFESVVNTSKKFNPDLELAQTVSGFGNDLEGVSRQYLELASRYERENVIFYIPPISAWHVKDMDDKGLLDYFLKSIHLISKEGFTIYDFSIVSDVTVNTKNTYDGSHYFPFVNERVVEVITGDNNGSNEFGLYVNGMTQDNYIAYHKNELGKLNGRLKRVTNSLKVKQDKKI